MSELDWEMTPDEIDYFERYINNSEYLKYLDTGTKTVIWSLLHEAWSLGTREYKWRDDIEVHWRNQHEGL